MAASSLSDVYKEYVATYGEGVNATQLTNYIEKEYQGQWTYSEVREFVQSQKATTSNNNNNSDRNSVSLKERMSSAGGAGGQVCLTQEQSSKVAEFLKELEKNTSDNNELKEDEKEAVIAINAANDKTQTHVNVVKDLTNALSSASITIDLNFVAKSDSFVLKTFCEIVGRLAAFLKHNNTQLLQEIPIVMKPQGYEPCDDDMWISSDLSVRKKINDNIWNPLNDGISSFLKLSNKFVDMRDEFIIVLGYIMWKPSYFETDDAKETIKKFELLNNKFIKSGDNNDDDQEEADLKENEKDMIEKYQDCFMKFHSVQKKLPGSASFKKLIDEIPKISDRINHFIDHEYNGIVNEHNNALEAKQREIETKIEQFNNLKNEAKKIHDKHTKAYDEENASECNRLEELYKQKQIDLKTSHEKIQNMEKLLKTFNENFENKTLKEMDKKLDDMQKKRQEMIDSIEKVTNETGMKYYNNIPNFVSSIEEAQLKSLSIAQRIIRFETLLLTLFEMGKRSVEINMINGNESPTIKWYFSLKTIGLESMVKHIHELNIKTIKELKSKYDSKLKCKNELIPYLEDKLKRKLKLGEKRKLRKICTVDMFSS